VFSRAEATPGEEPKVAADQVSGAPEMTTYTIHRYPAELIDVARLADGRTVTFRPVLPQDGNLVEQFLLDLSPEARRNRFLGPLREVPTSLLDRLMRVDYSSHLALLAEVFSDGAEVMIGEARYVVDADLRSAEFAVAVADGWQGQGIGRRLLHQLACRAAAEGIEHLYGYGLSTNRTMLRLARATGFEVRSDPGSAVTVRLEKALPREAYEPCRAKARALAAA
jgi:acetyltransferase